MNLILVGLMGSGKSAVGRLLAAKLGRPLVDTDRLVEEAAGCTIPELFVARGEAAFRELEAQVIAQVCGRKAVQAGQVGDQHAAQADAQQSPQAGETVGQQPRETSLVIATGGGAVLRPENREAMRGGGLVIWLDAAPEALYQRAQAQGVERRPLLAGPDPLGRLRALAAERAPAYAAAAHHRITTDDRSPAQVVAAILSLLGG